MVEGKGAFGTYGMYATFILLIVLSVLFKTKKIEYNKFLMLLVILFVFTTTVSALFNSEILLLFNAFLFLCLFLSATLITNSFFKESIAKVVAYTAILSHVPIIIIPLLKDGVVLSAYRGIFHNPNAFGQVAATLFAFFFALLLSKAEKTLFNKEKPFILSLLVYFLLTTFSFLLVAFSSSRTSFLAGVVVIITGLSLIILFSIKHKMLTNLAIKTFVSLPVVGVLYFLVNKLIPINKYVQANIFSKFERKIEDPLDGRGNVWIETAGNAGLFGNGEGYFINELGLGAHNTFVYIMGVYGWIPMIIFTVFFIVALYYCFRFALDSNHEFKQLPLIMLLTFLVLAMGEVLMYKFSMIAAFILIGLAANNKQVTITK